MFGKRVIVRGKDSGVQFGTLAERDGSYILLKDARRIWFWSGAASLSQLAMDGVAHPKDCKFTVPVDEIAILDAIEIILCSDKAIESVNGVTPWTAR